MLGEGFYLYSVEMVLLMNRSDYLKLYEDEEIIEDVHPSYFAFKGMIAASVLLFIIGLILVSQRLGAGLVYMFLVVVPLFILLVKRANHTRYIVTTQRIVKLRYWFSRSKKEVQIEQIRSIGEYQSMLGRTLGIGSVRVDSIGYDGLLRFSGVRDYESLARSVKKQQRRVVSNRDGV